MNDLNNLYIELNDVWKCIPKIFEVNQGLISYEQYLKCLYIDDEYRKIMKEMMEKKNG